MDNLAHTLTGAALAETGLKRAAGLEGFRNWSRLPAFDTKPLPGGGWTVRIRDVRYSGFGGRGPGAATVTLDASLRVVAVHSGS